MKRITNIHQLQARREMLKQRREDLEAALRLEWEAMKESLKPLSLAKEACNKSIESKLQQSLKGDSLFKNSITYSAALLGKKFAEKAKDKLDQIFHR